MLTNVYISALIVCVYEDPVVPEQAATVTEKLGEYLISVGYWAPLPPTPPQLNYYKHLLASGHPPPPLDARDQSHLFYVFQLS